MSSLPQGIICVILKTARGQQSALNKSRDAQLLTNPSKQNSTHSQLLNSIPGCGYIGLGQVRLGQARLGQAGEHLTFVDSDFCSKRPCAPGSRYSHLINFAYIYSPQIYFLYIFNHHLSFYSWDYVKKSNSKKEFQLANNKSEYLQIDPTDGHLIC